MHFYHSTDDMPQPPGCFAYMSLALPPHSKNPVTIHVQAISKCNILKITQNSLIGLLAYLFTAMVLSIMDENV